MKGIRLTAAVFGAVVAACSGLTPTRAPTVAPVLTPIPVITLGPSPSTLITAPPATCRPGFASATLEVPTLDLGTVSIDLAPVDPLPDGSGEPLATTAPLPTIDVDVPLDGTVLGGSQLRARLVVDTEQLGDEAAITSIAVEFQPEGRPVWIAAQTVIDGSVATVTVPDVDAKGFLRATVAWTTKCDAGHGAGELALAVLHSSIAAGCPTTGEALGQLALDLDGSRVSYDAVDVPVGITGWSARWTPGEAGGDFAQFSGWDRTRSVAATTGTSIVLRESIDDLSLVSVRAAFYERDDVEDYLDPSSTIELNSVDIQRRSAGEKGRIGIPINVEPGRYVMEVQGEAQSPCLNLQTYQVISVDVSEPLVP